jgi:hypothetical protein
MSLLSFLTLTLSLFLFTHTHTHSEWLVLYCGASASLGDTLDQYCKQRGIKYKTEFFGW